MAVNVGLDKPSAYIFQRTCHFNALHRFPARLRLCSFVTVGTQHFSKSEKEGGRSHLGASPISDMRFVQL